MTIEPRLTLARDDLADADLQGVVRAGRFAETKAYHCAASATAIRSSDDLGGEQLDQLLYGETFRVLETGRGWGWGQAERDGYVGYVWLADLQPGAVPATHKVSALRAYAFSRPDIKSRPVGLYSLGALVALEAEEGRFCKGVGTGWFVNCQLSRTGRFETDPASIAERYLGAPYQWGGRESLGLDCSGLIQQAFFACGMACPRDSDLQSLLGEPADPAALQRGALIFWKGHVAMMLDAQRMIHANAFHMQVQIEPLAEAAARIGEPVAYRRV